MSAARQPGRPPTCMACAYFVPVSTGTMRTLSSRSTLSSPELTLWMFNGLFMALELFQDLCLGQNGTQPTLKHWERVEGGAIRQA